jgi:hypothetical protein
MLRVKLLLRCIGEAVCAHGLRGLAGVVPFGEVLYDVARDAYERFRHDQDEQQLRQALQDAVQAGVQEVRAEALAAAREVAAGQPPEVEQRLADYLTQVPAAVRQSLRRPSDPAGTTVPPNFTFGQPENLLRFLPNRLPKFKPGEYPFANIDLELVELLGMGGFGEVWKAQNPYQRAEPPVALKFCLSESAARSLRHETDLLDRVKRQGTHGGFVKLLRTYLRAEPPCLEYEYIEGGDLSGLLREWADLPAAERCSRATEVMTQLAGIVGLAHRLSPPIVHRDLKPANILVQRVADGWTLRVTDFGIGSVVAEEAIRATRQGSETRGGVIASELRGAHTPLYASPQQMRGALPDVRDDVYSLGVIWYQLVTGDLTSGAPTGNWTSDLAGGGDGSRPDPPSRRVRGPPAGGPTS